ncbi:MAG: T9SS type A sorting domain-containing protein [Bacteroidetes bacterium]|nr:T9SS type A sorting domain-containing protein [Bacteroidota bacterium]
MEGLGVTITNMSITAAPSALASYSVQSALLFGNGIVMSTGKVNNSINSTNTFTFPGTTNTVSSIMSNDNGYVGDADLTSIAGANTYDACIIEFDCISNTTSLLFDFAFASEEYPLYVNGVNDVFAIFVTGPNPSGGNYLNENFAVIPGTNTAISINTVNNGNHNLGPCMNCSYYINNSGDTDTGYNGYTVDLLGLVDVIPGQQYHLKIAIADALDKVYDSAIFLKAYSFRSTIATDVKSQSNANNILIYPLPASDKIYIKYAKPEALHIELFSIDGKKIEVTLFDTVTPYIDVESLDSGIYFLHLSSANETMVKKIMVK